MSEIYWTLCDCDMPFSFSFSTERFHSIILKRKWIQFHDCHKLEVVLGSVYCPKPNKSWISTWNKGSVQNKLFYKGSQKNCRISMELFKYPQSEWAHILTGTHDPSHRFLPWENGNSGLEELIEDLMMRDFDGKYMVFHSRFRGFYREPFLKQSLTLN